MSAIAGWELDWELELWPLLAGWDCSVEGLFGGPGIG